MDTLRNKKIWIIGASSGIGAALAAELSRRGAQLTLSARRQDVLEKISSTLAAPAIIAPLNVCDSDHLRITARTQGPFDSVIFLAATYNPGLIEDMNINDAHQMVDTNINGALNTIDAVYADMRNAGRGQIVLCGSVAGYCGLPNSQPYSLSKAAIMNLAQSLHAEAVHHNIDVKLISPGFVRTPLTDKNTFNMPLIMEPDEAAHIIADGLTAHAFEIHFPKKLTFALKILSILPYGLYFKIVGKILNSKSGSHGK